MSEIQIGWVVQIKPEGETFDHCFMVVTEVKSWGLLGYIEPPGQEGVCPYRVQDGNYSPVGPAEYVRADMFDELPVGFKMDAPNG